jgi:hypothetical protein
MKKLCLVVVAVFLLLSFPMRVHADGEAKYNFASIQGAKELSVSPGQSTEGVIYFYNIDGNRITHVTLKVSQAPAGWEVTVEPPLLETEVLVNDMPVTVEENLYVDPTELLSQEPEDVPEDMVSIKIPGRGYTLGKTAKVLVRVPESVPIGSKGEIIVAGEAAWLGQGGSAALKQVRDFDFSLTVVSLTSDYNETIIGQNGTDDAIETGLASNWMLPLIIAVVVTAVVSGVIFSRRKKPV